MFVGYIVIIEKKTKNVFSSKRIKNNVWLCVSIRGAKILAAGSNPARTSLNSALIVVVVVFVLFLSVIDKNHKVNVSF